MHNDDEIIGLFILRSMEIHALLTKPPLLRYVYEMFCSDILTHSPYLPLG